jgi:DUF4097 and DUF4098 domain-containing protein YvlB
VSARRRGSLLFGLALCGAAVILTLAPMLPIGILTRGWPLLLVAAGGGFLAGFALKRRPASPALGAALLVAGGLALAFNITGASGPFAFYGRWWPLFIGVFAIVEVVRHYSAPSTVRSAILTKGKLALLLLIMGSGLAAQRIAAVDPNLVAQIDFPLFSQLRDSFFGRQFAFEPTAKQAELVKNGVVRVANRFGDVRVEPVDGDQVQVSLSARVRAYDQAAADAVFKNLRLDVDRSDTGVTVGTNRSEIQRQLSTDLVVRVPRRAAVRVENDHGAITVSGLEPGETGMKLETSYAAVSVTDIAGPVEVRNHHGDVQLSNVRGAITIGGPYSDVVLKTVEGSVLLEGVDDVSIDGAKSSSIRLVDVNHAGVVAKNISAPGAGEKCLVEFTGSHTDLTMANIAGDVTIKTTHGDISATDVAGMFDVTAEHSEVKVTRVGSLRVTTSYDDVNATDVVGAVDVENEHGDIVLRLPVGPRYDITPTVDHGKVRIDNAFERPIASDSKAIPITLKTTYDDIVVKPSGSRSSGGESPRTGEKS